MMKLYSGDAHGIVPSELGNGMECHQILERKDFLVGKIFCVSTFLTWGFIVSGRIEYFCVV